MRLLFLLSLAFSPCLLSAQALTLALYDVVWDGDSAAISNQDIVGRNDVADDHPVFHPTARVLYYISQSGNGSEIRAYDYDRRNDSTILSHPNIATRLRIIPDESFITFLSRDNSELMFHPLKDGIPLRKPISGLTMQNYCWIDDNSLLVIQPGDPNSLNLATLRPRKIAPVVKHVGATLQQTTGVLAFVHKLSVDSWSIKKITSDGKISILSETFPDAEIFAISDDEKLLMAFDGTLYCPSPSGDWKEVRSFPHSAIKSIGINATGDKLFVLFALQ